MDEILERHAKLIEVNQNAKLPSAYLIAKIDNAKEALEFELNLGKELLSRRIITVGTFSESEENKEETAFVEDLEKQAKGGC